MTVAKVVRPPITSAMLGKQTQPRMSSHDIICWHTMAGYLVTTDGYFRVTNGPGFDGTEAHFGTGGAFGPDLRAHLDGKIYQWQDLLYTADANYQGNSRVISIENADNAVRPIAPFSPAQLQSGINLGAWLCTVEAHSRCSSSWACHQGVQWNGITVAIPPVAVPDSKPGRRGLAWHAQGARDHVSGGEWWSTTPSKDCPTNVRITQCNDIIFPGIRKLLQTGEVPDMALTPEDKDWIHNTVLRAVLVGLTGGANAYYPEIDDSPASVQGWKDASVRGQVANVSTKLDTIVANTKPTA